MQLKNLLRLLFSAFFLFSSVFFRILQIPTVGSIMLLKNEKVARAAMYQFGGYWLDAMISYTHHVAPSSYVVSFEDKTSEESTIRNSSPPTIRQIQAAFDGLEVPEFPDHREIMICNHQIYADWLYLWGFLSHFNRASSIKIVMKESLKYVPLVGFAMKMLGFIFLKRDWRVDQKSFIQSMRQLDDYQLPYDLLIFPEGTTFYAEGLENSKQFSRERGYPDMDHVLCPRSTGMYAAIKALKERSKDKQEDDSLQGVLDLTIGYSGIAGDQEPSRVYGLRTIFKDGHSPKEIHINVSYIPIESIPTDNQEEFTNWLVGRFERKDRLLKQFYSGKHFPAAIECKPKRISLPKSDFVLAVYFLELFTFLTVLFYLTS